MQKVRASVIFFFCLIVSVEFGYSGQFVVHSQAQWTQATARAVQGDTIQLASGVYDGPLEITRRLTILGSRDAIIDGNGAGNVLTIRADSCVIQGITIRNSGARLLKDDAGIKLFSDGNRIENCRIERALHGIYIQGGNSNQILANVITGHAQPLLADRGNGIHLWNTRGNIIRNNDISKVRDGIYFSFAHDNTIDSNRVHQSRYGIHYMYSDTNRFHRNTLEHNVAGAALMYSRDIQFRSNIFRNNRGGRAYGLLLQTCDYSLAEHNTVVNNTVGIFLDNSNYNELRFNTVHGNETGLRLNASSDGNLFHHNVFTDNLLTLLKDGQGEQTRWAQKTGNYWGNYTGVDINGDKIGDLPHRIENALTQLIQQHPFLQLYQWSPAASALEILTTALPVLRRPGEIDPKPLLNPPDIDEGEPSTTAGFSPSLCLAGAGLFLLAMGLFMRMRHYA